MQPLDIEAHQESHSSHPTRRAIPVFISLLRGDFAALAVALLPYIRRWLKRHYDGIYEVLDYEAHIDLCDPLGQKVVFAKRQRVRFLQNNVSAVQDQAWGDGEIFSEYRCSPGIPVDRYREGHRYRILISLRETKNRGDELDLHIRRVIRDGFTHPVEEFQLEIDHQTRNLSCELVFPKERPPRRAMLLELNAKRTEVLDPSHIQTLPDGRTRVDWKRKRPQLFEAYVLRWEW